MSPRDAGHGDTARNRRELEAAKIEPYGGGFLVDVRGEAPYRLLIQGQVDQGGKVRVTSPTIADLHMVLEGVRRNPTGEYDADGVSWTGISRNHGEAIAGYVCACLDSGAMHNIGEDRSPPSPRGPSPLETVGTPPPPWQSEAMAGQVDQARRGLEAAGFLLHYGQCPVCARIPPVYRERGLCSMGARLWGDLHPVYRAALQKAATLPAERPPSQAS